MRSTVLFIFAAFFSPLAFGSTLFNPTGQGVTISLAPSSAAVYQTPTQNISRLSLNSVSANSASLTFQQIDPCPACTSGTDTETATITLILNQPQVKNVGEETLTFTLLQTGAAAEILVVEPSGTIDAAALTQSSANFTLSGTAIAVPDVLVEISACPMATCWGTSVDGQVDGLGRWQVPLTGVPTGSLEVIVLSGDEQANIAYGTLNVKY